MSKGLDFQIHKQHTLAQGWHANRSQQTCNSVHKYTLPIQGLVGPHMQHSKGVCI